MLRTAALVSTTLISDVALPSHKGLDGDPTTRLTTFYPTVPSSRIATDGNISWERVILAEGPQCPIIADTKIPRVIKL